MVLNLMLVCMAISEKLRQTDRIALYALNIVLLPGYKCASYFHCIAHRLNLGLATAAKVDQNVKKILTT